MRNPSRPADRPADNLVSQPVLMSDGPSAEFGRVAAFLCRWIRFSASAADSAPTRRITSPQPGFFDVPTASARATSSLPRRTGRTTCSPAAAVERRRASISRCVRLAHFGQSASSPLRQAADRHTKAVRGPSAAFVGCQGSVLSKQNGFSGKPRFLQLAAAKHFGVRLPPISQLRHELARSWGTSVGEPAYFDQPASDVG
jgi:hypothetical protein